MPRDECGEVAGEYSEETTEPKVMLHFEIFGCGSNE